jgi:hypothetical protein
VVGIFAIAKTLSQNQRSAPVKLDGREQASVKVLNNNLLPFKKSWGGSFGSPALDLLTPKTC